MDSSKCGSKPRRFYLCRHLSLRFAARTSPVINLQIDSFPTHSPRLQPSSELYTILTLVCELKLSGLKHIMVVLNFHISGKVLFGDRKVHSSS